MTLLSLDRVACARGGRLLFRDLSVQVDAGGACLVAGPNGAGKSSLLRLAAGLLRPLEGRVERAAASILAEASALDAERTVADALAFWRVLDGRAGGDDGLAAVGLVHLAPVPVRLLSTGQRRRVALARVVASATPLWLLDEPANGLDTAAVGLLERLIAHHRAGGGGVVVATHSPIDLPGADRIVLG